jgi:hypothetical protein
MTFLENPLIHYSIGAQVRRKASFDLSQSLILVSRDDYFSGSPSDSIACLTGAFAGSHRGLSAWPAHWIEQIEYRNQIHALCDWLSSI